MRLWGEDKRLERRRRAICYIPKSHLLPESSCFSDICPRWLAKQSRAVDQLMQSSLRKSIGISLWLQSSLKIALGYLSSAIPSEGKPLRPDGGALESEEMGPFIMKLLLFSHLWHFLHVEPETVWLSQIKSYLSGGDNQVSYSCWLDKNRNGNGIEGLLILGAFFLESSWWIDALCSSKRLKALLLILCIVKYAGWMDCRL